MIKFSLWIWLTRWACAYYVGTLEICLVHSKFLLTFFNDKFIMQNKLVLKCVFEYLCSISIKLLWWLVLTVWENLESLTRLPSGHACEGFSRLVYLKQEDLTWKEATTFYGLETWCICNWEHLLGIFICCFLLPYCGNSVASCQHKSFSLYLPLLGTFSQHQEMEVHSVYMFVEEMWSNIS